MALYFIEACDQGTGESFDLFVRSESVEKALEEWRKYWGREKNADLTIVFLVPETGEGALPWFKPEGVRQVWPEEAEEATELAEVEAGE